MSVSDDTVRRWAESGRSAASRDGLLAQVDMRCGPFRVVSVMTAEAADELKLEPGVLAVASVKSSSAVVEVPAP